MDQYICNHGNQNFRVLHLKKWFLIIGVIVLSINEQVRDFA